MAVAGDERAVIEAVSRGFGQRDLALSEQHECAIVVSVYDASLVLKCGQEPDFALARAQIQCTLIVRRYEEYDCAYFTD